MDVEDVVICAYDLNDDGPLAFTDFGVDALGNLIKFHQDIAASRDG